MRQLLIHISQTKRCALIMWQSRANSINIPNAISILINSTSVTANFNYSEWMHYKKFLPQNKEIVWVSEAGKSCFQILKTASADLYHNYKSQFHFGSVLGDPCTLLQVTHAPFYRWPTHLTTGDPRSLLQVTHAPFYRWYTHLTMGDPIYSLIDRHQWSRTITYFP